MPGNASHVDRVVVGSAGNDQITVVDARGITVMGGLGSQPDSNYVPPQLSPKAVQVPDGTEVQLVASNGRPPYRMTVLLPGTVPDVWGGGIRAGSDGASWVLVAGLGNIHQPDDQTPQRFIVTDMYGRSDTASVSVFPRVVVYPSEGVVYGNGLFISASGGINPGAESLALAFAENLSGGTLVPDPNDPSRATYTPGPTTGVTDVLVVKDSEGNQAEARFEVKAPLAIVEANGAPPAQGVVRLEVGQVLQFHGVGGTGEGYRWGNYNNYTVNGGVERGNGTVDSATGEYTARKAGEDQVYVNDSANNAYTIKVEIQ